MKTGVVDTVDTSRPHDYQAVNGSEREMNALLRARACEHVAGILRLTGGRVPRNTKWQCLVL
eukprot:15465164-Alexandrium_andersonii.AAC.1